MVYERGVETVRRDATLLVSETMSAVFFLVLWCGDKEAACEIIRLVVSQLWMCEVPMSKLVMCKVSGVWSFAGQFLFVFTNSSLRRSTRRRSMRICSRTCRSLRR